MRQSPTRVVGTKNRVQFVRQPGAMDLGDSLLHPELGEAGADQDLLPTGTQTYVSVCRYSRIYWLIVAGMFTVFPILLLIATINSGAVWLILTILWL